MTFVVVLHGLWAAAPLAGALKNGSGTDLGLAVAWSAVLGLNLWRLLQRACVLQENRLRVRGSPVGTPAKE